MIEVIDKFRFQIRDRKDRKFYGAKTATSLKLLPAQKCEELMQDFDVSFWSRFKNFNNIF